MEWGYYTQQSGHREIKPAWRSGLLASLANIHSHMSCMIAYPADISYTCYTLRDSSASFEVSMGGNPAWTIILNSSLQSCIIGAERPPMARQIFLPDSTLQIAIAKGTKLTQHPKMATLQLVICRQGAGEITERMGSRGLA